MLGAVLLSALLVGCDEGVAQNAAPQAPTVSAADVVVKSISQWDSFNGRIEAVESVQLRPRVSGYIDKVNYTDGQEVKRRYCSRSMTEPIAPRWNRRRQRWQSQNTGQRRKARQTVPINWSIPIWSLVKSGSSAALLPSSPGRHSRRTGGGGCRAAELDFTKVTAPIDGRASRALITSGNLVTAGDSASVLTTLVSQKTVYVYFDVDESTYLHYQKLALSGQGAASNHRALPVEIGLVGEDGYPHQGKVDFLDNQLTPSTGTIRMRALLDNTQRQFTPGLFARVRLPGSAEFEPR